MTGKFDVNAFADRLWGDIYFNKEERKFSKKQSDPDQQRSFVHFVLEPLYKLYNCVLTEEGEELKATLERLGIHLKPVMFKMDARPLLKVVLDQFFGPSTGLVDVIVEHIPSPVANARNKVFQPCDALHHSTDIPHRSRLPTPALRPRSSPSR